MLILNVNNIYIDLLGYRFYFAFLIILLTLLALVGMIVYKILQSKKIENQETFMERAEYLDKEEFDVPQDIEEEIEITETEEIIEKEIQIEKPKIKTKKNYWEHPLNRVVSSQRGLLLSILDKSFSYYQSEVLSSGQTVQQWENSSIFKLLTNIQLTIKELEYWDTSELLKLQEDSIMESPIILMTGEVNVVLMETLDEYFRVLYQSDYDDSTVDELTQDLIVQMVNLINLIDVVNGGLMEKSQTEWVKPAIEEDEELIEIEWEEYLTGIQINQKKVKEIEEEQRKVEHEMNSMVSVIKQSAEELYKIYDLPDNKELVEALPSPLQDKDRASIEYLIESIYQEGYEVLQDLNNTDIFTSILLHHFDVLLREKVSDINKGENKRNISNSERAILRSASMLLTLDSYRATALAIVKGDTD